MASKSPASATRPSWERSRFDDGTGAKAAVQTTGSRHADAARIAVPSSVERSNETRFLIAGGRDEARGEEEEGSDGQQKAGGVADLQLARRYESGMTECDSNRVLVDRNWPSQQEMGRKRRDGGRDAGRDARLEEAFGEAAGKQEKTRS